MSQPRRTPTQARATRTRQTLLEAAAIDFSERGYAGTTARSIAQRAEAATGSFYQYFNDKDEVLHEIYALRRARIREAAQALLETMPTHEAPSKERTRQALSAIVQLVFDLHREDPKLHAVITEREHADERMRAQTHQALGELVKAAASMLTHLGYPGDVLARAFLIVSLIEGSVHAHVLGEPVVSDRRFKKDLVEALDALTQQRSEPDHDR